MQHPDSFIVISGDFNHVSLATHLIGCAQYVDVLTRENCTIDLLYANAKVTYTASGPPPLGNHILVSLQPSSRPSRPSHFTDRADEFNQFCNRFDTVACACTAPESTSLSPPHAHHHHSSCSPPPSSPLHCRSPNTWMHLGSPFLSQYME